MVGICTGWGQGPRRTEYDRGTHAPGRAAIFNVGESLRRYYEQLRCVGAPPRRLHGCVGRVGGAVPPRQYRGIASVRKACYGEELAVSFGTFPIGSEAC